MPMPKSAMRIGRPIASSEPNATSRMTMAARMPIELGRPEPTGLLEHAAAERDVQTVATGGVGEVADALDGGVGDLRRLTGRTGRWRTRRHRCARPGARRPACRG